MIDARRPSRRKYGNQPCELDGYHFDSRKEQRRYRVLKIVVAGGAISDLQVHPSWDLHIIGGVRIARYTADFSYLETETGRLVVEDCKSPQTRKETAYRIRKRWMAAEYGIDIQEV